MLLGGGAGIVLGGAGSPGRDWGRWSDGGTGSAAAAPAAATTSSITALKSWMVIVGSQFWLRLVDERRLLCLHKHTVPCNWMAELLGLSLAEYENLSASLSQRSAGSHTEKNTALPAQSVFEKDKLPFFSEMGEGGG